MSRLKDEYSVEALYEPVEFHTARWLTSESNKELDAIKKRYPRFVAIDGDENLTFLAPSQWRLQQAEEEWPKITFQKTREHQ